MTSRVPSGLSRTTNMFWSGGRRVRLRETLQTRRAARTDHRSDLGQKVIFSDEPKILRVSLLGGLDLRNHSGRVVRSEPTKNEGRKISFDSRRVQGDLRQTCIPQFLRVPLERSARWP
jgi:hypothetical protein